MKKLIFLVLAMVMITTLVITPAIMADGLKAQTAQAQAIPTQPSDIYIEPVLTTESTNELIVSISNELEAAYGGRNLTPATIPDGIAVPLTVLATCPLPEITRDPLTAGDIGVNSSQIYRAYSCFDRQTNTTWFRIGTTWWGSDGDTQRLFGLITVRDATTEEIIAPLPFDVSNIPDVDQQALWVDIPYQGPLNGKQYKFYLEALVRQLPCNNGPSAYTATLTYTMGLGQIIVSKTGDYISGAVFELWGRLSEKDPWIFIQSRMIAPWDVGEINGIKTGQIDFLVPGPISSTYANYKVLERIDLLPQLISPEPANGIRELTVDVGRPLVYARFVNRTYNIFFPIVNSDGDEPVPTPTPTPLPTPTPVPLPGCPDVRAKFTIEGTVVKVCKFDGVCDGVINLKYYQALYIALVDASGNSFTMPNGGSWFELNGVTLFTTGRGPFIKVYPGQLPIYQTSRWIGKFTAPNGEICKVIQDVYDP